MDVSVCTKNELGEIRDYGKRKIGLLRPNDEAEVALPVMEKQPGSDWLVEIRCPAFADRGVQPTASKLS